MKTTVLIVTILITILFSSVLIAQEENEIKFSYGYSGIDFDRSSAFGSDDKTYGTLTFSYNRRVHKKVSIGIQVNYTYAKEQNWEYQYDEYGHPIPVELPSEIKQIFKPSVKIDYFYKTKPDFELYSGVMLSPVPKLVPHFTLIGFKYGTKHAVFGELGVGYGQLMSAGYAYKF